MDLSTPIVPIGFARPAGRPWQGARVERRGSPSGRVYRLGGGCTCVDACLSVVIYCVS